MTVTVVSCVYGEHYYKFVPRWLAAVEDLDPQPDAVIVATDGGIEIPDVKIIESFCHWRYPQAWHQQQAIMAATTKWVWLLDIDDLAMPDGLAGLENVKGDVWAVGYERSDGETYLPPQGLVDVLSLDKSVYPGGSMIRTDIFREVGGFSDVALQDWSMWRKLARYGATFTASRRTHFRYMRHPMTRGATELTLDVRADHYAEMLEAELAHA